MLRLFLLVVLIVLGACATTAPGPTRTTPPTVRLEREAGCRVVDDRVRPEQPIVDEKTLCEQTREAVAAALVHVGYRLVEGSAEVGAKLSATFVARPGSSKVSLAARLSASRIDIDQVVRHVELQTSIAEAVGDAAKDLVDAMLSSAPLRELGLVP